MAANFKKLKPTRIFQHAADQIQAAILDGSFSPGDTLPSEMKLKEMFDTSRGTIREALRVLEQKGLIDIKVGGSGGAVVKELDAGQITESLALLIEFQKVSHDHLAEFREHVEGAVVYLAAQRATPSDIEKLTGLLEEIKNVVESNPGDWQRFAKIDIKLHITIAEIAGNPIFTALAQMIHENLFESSDKFTFKGEAILKQSYGNLCRLVEKIQEGSDEDARTLVQENIRKANTHMKQNLL